MSIYERYWVVPNGNFTGSNWSTTSGGSSGASIPDSSGMAIFDRFSGYCTIDSTPNIFSLDLRSDYTNTVLYRSPLYLEKLNLSGGLLNTSNDSSVFLSGDASCHSSYGSLSLSNNARVIMDSSKEQYITCEGGIFPSLYIDKTSTNPIKLLGSTPLSMLGDLIVYDGTFNTNSHDIILLPSSSALPPIPSLPFNVDFTWGLPFDVDFDWEQVVECCCGSSGPGPIGAYADFDYLVEEGSGTYYDASFIDLSVGATSWAMTISDGSSYSSFQTTHRFYTNDPYTVTLSINSNTSSMTQTVIGAIEPYLAWYKGENDTVDSIHGNNGTWLGGADYTTGYIGDCFKFIGASNNYITTPSSVYLNHPYITVECWIKRTAVAGYADVLVKKSNDGNGFALEFDAYSNDLRFFVNTGAWVSSGNAAITLGVWTHVKGVYDGNIVAIYVNDVLINSSFASGSIVSSAADLTIGGWTSRAYNGLIDEVKIYDSPVGPPS